MIVVIDTNVVLQALNPAHRHGVILDAWYAGRLTWAVSTDILFEYQEVITRQSGPQRWSQLSRILDLAPRHQHNLIQVAPAFQFLAIPADRDDDKFADCAIAAHADFIITADRHFRPLIGSGYKAQPILPDEFISRYLPSS